MLQLSDGQRFHILFEEAVESLLSAVQETENKNTRLVIFIDDLDRCEEKIVVRMLECIKLYLASHRCVFVLGIDDAAVAHLSSLETRLMRFASLSSILRELHSNAGALERDKH